MSKTRWVSAFAAGMALMLAACWFVTGAIPLAAEPQMVADAAGVAVNTNGAELIHRSVVAYPAAAQAQGIQGAVVAQLRLDANGEVADATIVSGPDELRRAVLQSVLTWHFAKEAANSTRTVNVDFTLLAGVGAASAAPATAPANAVPAVRMQASSAALTVKAIEVRGLSGQARDELLAQLPVHAGDALTAENIGKLAQAVHRFDSHLNVVPARDASGEAVLRIAPSPASAFAAAVAQTAQAAAADSANPPQRIRVGANVQAANLVSGPKPEYPALAKQAKISGTVVLQAEIGRDGAVEDLKVISGHPLLIQATLDAVRNWVYRPTLLNGQPVDVVTTIDVNFTLSE